MGWLWVVWEVALFLFALWVGGVMATNSWTPWVRWRERWRENPTGHALIFGSVVVFFGAAVVLGVLKQFS